MFRLSLQPVNPDVAKYWLIGCGASVGGTVSISVAAVVGRIHQLFPAAVLERLPNYQQFMYMALALALVPGLVLLGFRKVVCVSLAQMGFASGLQYLGFSLLGVFAHGYEPVLIGLMVLTAIVLAVVFSQGLSYYANQKSYSDLLLGCGMLASFFVIWLYPAWKLWRPT